MAEVAEGAGKMPEVEEAAQAPQQPRGMNSKDRRGERYREPLGPRRAGQKLYGGAGFFDLTSTIDPFYCPPEDLLLAHEDLMAALSDQDPNDKHQEMRLFLLQNAKTRNWLHRTNYYPKIVNTLNDMRKEQLGLLSRSSTMNYNFVRCMESILYLGHPVGHLKARSEKWNDSLISAHQDIIKWGTNIQELTIDSKNKDLKLKSEIDNFKTTFGPDVEGMTFGEFKTRCSATVGARHFFLRERDQGKVFKRLDMSGIYKEWEKFRGGIDTELFKLEQEFKRFSIHYGYRKSNPQGHCDSTKEHVFHTLNRS